jgi:uncharacterized alkaline shock family protein YloU
MEGTGGRARAGRYDSTRSAPPDPTGAATIQREELVPVAIRPTPGRSLVTGRALIDLVRTATLGSYGVTGFAGGPVARLVARLGLGQPGLVVRLDDGIEVELDLTVALGVPVAEVARQVDSAVRYAIRRALDREVNRLVIHVDGLRVQPGATVPAMPRSAPTALARAEPAESGSDVA